MHVNTVQRQDLGNQALILQQLQTLQESKDKGNLLVMTPETYKNYFLMWIESLQHNIQSDPQNNNLVQETLREILDFYKEKGFAVVDEWDAVVHPLKSELNYPIGSRVSFNPLRWTFADQLLEMAHEEFNLHPEEKIATIFNKRDVAIGKELLDKDYYKSVMKRSLIEKALRKIGRLYPESVNLSNTQLLTYYCLWQEPVEQSLREEICRFLRVNDSDDVVVKAKLEMAVSAIYKQNDKSRDAQLAIVMIREWLGNIVPHIFSKKHRINYGPSENGSRIAVPYLSKDKPSLSSEFSNADIQIGFTLLSYRYKGLSKSEIKQLLLGLRKAERATKLVVSEWCGSSTCLPFETMDIEKPELLDDFYNRLHRHKDAIFYFLSTSVFPVELKQYEKMLSTNGIEMSLLNSKHTVGFTGTTHNKDSYLDESIVRPQAGNDGKLIAALMDPNFHTVVEKTTPNNHSDMLSEFDFTSSMALIDGGAWIIEHSNKEVAEHILERTSPDQVHGVGYIDEKTRKKRVLLRSGIVEDMQETVVPKKKMFMYFSHSDIRGVDVELESDVSTQMTVNRAMALDDTFQAAMRLRKFGETQKITTLIPKELRVVIRQTQRLNQEESIGPAHLLKWFKKVSEEQNVQASSVAVRQKIKALAKKIVLDISKNQSYVFKNIMLQRVENWIAFSPLFISEQSCDYVQNHLSLGESLSLSESLQREIDAIFKILKDCPGMTEVIQNEFLNKALAIKEKVILSLSGNVTYQTEDYEKEMECVDEKNQMREEETQKENVQLKCRTTATEAPFREKSWNPSCLINPGFHIGYNGSATLGNTGPVLQKVALFNLENVYVTENFNRAFRSQEPESQTGPLKEINHIVELTNESGTQYVIVSNKEADRVITYLRKVSENLSETKIRVWNANGKIVAEAQKPMRPEPPLIAAPIRPKFRTLNYIQEAKRIEEMRLPDRLLMQINLLRCTPQNMTKLQWEELRNLKAEMGPDALQVQYESHQLRYPSGSNLED